MKKQKNDLIDKGDQTYLFKKSIKQIHVQPL